MPESRLEKENARLREDLAAMKKGCIHRAVYDAVPDPTLIAESATGRIVEANDAAVALFRRKREELVGLHFTDIHPRETRESARAEFENRPPDGSPPPPIRIDVESSDGAIHTVELHGRAFVHEGVDYTVGVFRDITERLGVEEELRKSEERLRTQIERAPFSVQVLSPNGETIYVNKAFERLWGLRLEDLEGYNVFHDPQLRRRRVLPHLERAFAGEFVSIPAIEYDASEEFAKGGTRYVSAYAYAAHDSKGAIDSVVLMHEDVTDRREKERERETRERRFRGLTDHAPFSVHILDRDGNTLYVNRAFERLWGVSESEIRSYNLFRDPQLKRKGVIDDFRRAYVGERVELPLITYDADEFKEGGRRKIVSVVAYPLMDDRSRVENIIVIHQDVTEREDATRRLQRNEERFRAFAESSPDLILQYDRELRLLYANPTMERFYGMPVSTIVGKRFDEITTEPEDVEFWQDKLRAVFSTKRPLTVEYQYSFQGKSRDFFVIFVPDVIEDEARAVTAYARDVTSMKTRERELRDVNAAKDAFFSVVSHDLRDPLHSILSTAETLATLYDDFDDDERRRLVGLLFDSSKNFGDLLQGLLQWSSAQSGSMRLARRTVALRPLVEEALESVRGRAGDKNARLVNDVGDDEKVFVDPNVTKTVLRNLLTNAVKSIDEGGMTGVRARREGGKVLATVYDNGVGMSAATIENLFNPGARASGFAEGAGVGLTIVKDLLDRMGESVSARSEPNKGSEFTVTLEAAS
jgi:PAS domain S-box-containing protein